MINLEKILPRVQKPARYVGGEWNMVRKDWDKTPVKMAFAFPDVYEVGMSHLGLQILYHVVNSRPDTLMERAFAPWVDMEAEMRKAGLPLFTLESRRPVKDFDLIGFTLQYEMSFSNVLNMLDLAGIPLRAADRGNGGPLICAGGPCAFNPEPLADFIDFFVLGEGEEVLHDLLDLYRDCGGRTAGRAEFLRRAVRIPGIYVPSFYRVTYREDGGIGSIHPLTADVPELVTKRVVRGFDRAPFPTRPLVPSLGVVHDRAMLEVQRGCTRGCRFCQAGVIYRPVREKSPATLRAQAADLVRQTGFDEISLVSLSTADYSRVDELVHTLLDQFAGLGVSVSLPSLRVDAFSVALAREIQRVRRSSLTFAPEAGTQRLRDVINKGVTEEDLMAAVSTAFGAGWPAIKLYFMIGLPTETDDDLAGIARLARRVLAEGRCQKVPRGRLKVTVSASSFVPKPHTAFQWEPQDRLAELRGKQAYLRDALKEKGLVFHWHEPEVSFLEAALSRGDRRLGMVLEEAQRLGCRFDGWSECFSFDRWREAFRRTGLEPARYAYRRYNYDDILPWDHIGAGVSKAYLIKEHRRAMSGRPTPDCRAGKCPGCGLCPTLEIKPEIDGREINAPLPDQVQ
ncbi:TIGR03960 family B12-binding radical SAM protein [Desulfotomaculum copahuensis]|uniref:B12-binding domain-containing radical SAM protein n=1 Tax=Desulfotomaculum copahuensis TaxID=1838280 RepID=A0A1B7LHA9_9FIRM|nr:TIGR03960 family B12-binding radical SAM protein [Desulfotomaculum copahuensis]OAT85569.1 B12-binding domain-containing radical SAM protein [Desulfotomaculum copahuensis]